MKRLLKSLVLTVAIVSWMGGYVYFVMVTSYVQPEKRTEKTDVIVVLTGGNFRTTTGLSLFAEKLAPNLMITGVNKAITEDQIRERWKGDQALPACCIILGHEATTTRENAAEVKKWIKDQDIKSIRLVTSDYHMQRSMMEFRAALPEMTIIAHPVEDEDYSVNELKFWTLTFSEYNKYIVRGAVLGVQRGFQ